MSIRKALEKDVDRIHSLISGAAGSGAVLPRSKDEIRGSIRDFFVFDGGEKIIGTAALHVRVQKLAEIRSLVVESGHDGKGIGTVLVRACLEEAETLPVESVFVLTYAPAFFTRFGFAVTDKERFPHKIWTDCSKCLKAADCDETALIYTLAKKKSEIPRHQAEKVKV
jgi:amino-acid N-acetyltransferase